MKITAKDIHFKPDYELIDNFPTKPFESLCEFETFVFENSIGITNKNWEAHMDFWANEYDSLTGIWVYDLE